MPLELNPSNPGNIEVSTQGSHTILMILKFSLFDTDFQTQMAGKIPEVQHSAGDADNVA